MKLRRALGLGSFFALASWSALAFVSGCGGANASSPAPVIVQNDISITIVPAIDPVPFDPRAARIKQATDELFQVTGHGFELRFDQALIPQYEASFADALADSIESLAKSLATMKKHDAAEFAREVPGLVRVECHYNATADRYRDRDEAHYAGGVVTIAEPADGRSMIFGDDVVDALEDRFLEEMEARFLGKDPQQIGPADRAAYLAYVVSGHESRSMRKREREQQKQRPNGGSDHDRRATEILRVTKLATLTGSSDAKLAADIRTALLNEASYVTSESNFREGSPEATSGSIERQAQDAWVSWLNGALPSMNASERYAVGRAVFERERPLPGFDDFAFGLTAVDDWTKAGRPPEGPSDDPRFQLNDSVVCPPYYDSRGILERNRSCRSGWAKHALESDADTKRLADAVAKRNETKLEEGLAYELQYGDDGRLLRLWRALEPYPEAWHRFSRSVLERLSNHPAISDDEANRIWRDHPPYRGTSLYILSLRYRDSDLSYADTRFGDFEKRYGTGVGPDVFASFLDEGPGAFATTPEIWLALTKGWRRATVVASHLDRLLADPLPRFESYGTAEKALGGIAARMCKDGGAGELAELHDALVARARTHPENARELENVIADTAAGHCEANAATAKKRAKEDPFN